MKVTVNAIEVIKMLDSGSDYMRGINAGMEVAGPIIARRLGELAKVLVTKYIDSKHSAGSLHHVYEWGGGSKLFHFRLTVAGSIATITTVFQQSNSVSATSDEPFRRKAWIMEEGTPLHIDANPFLNLRGISDDLWVGRDVIIPQPGGPGVQGSFERAFDEFFATYFAQMLGELGFNNFLQASGLMQGFPYAGFAGGKAAVMRWVDSMPGIGNVV